MSNVKEMAGVQVIRPCPFCGGFIKCVYIAELNKMGITPADPNTISIYDLIDRLSDMIDSGKKPCDVYHYFVEQIKEWKICNEIVEELYDN
jgi:hypothetical protein